MAIMKKKWQELIANVDAHDILDDISQEAEFIDSKLNAKTQSFRSHDLQDLVEYVRNTMLTTGGAWVDLPIFVSSYKYNDKRIIHLIKNKVREYIVFYEKLLTDEGVSRRLSYSKEYENAGSASSVDRGINSETPQNSSLYDSSQPESDALFDEAIADYASNINKSKASQSSSNEGSSTTLVTGGTWEEQKKNIELMFFNELKEYIISIPDRIYSWYSIDTVPAPELAIMQTNYLKDIAELMKSYE